MLYCASCILYLIICIVFKCLCLLVDPCICANVCCMPMSSFASVPAHFNREEIPSAPHVHKYKMCDKIVLLPTTRWENNYFVGLSANFH